MKKYNWKGYDFIGTVPEFAEKFGHCKTPTFVNALKSVSRQRYNRMDADEQKEYDEKRRRAKRAYCIYMDENLTDCYIVTKEEYLATRLPVKEKPHETFMLTYRDRVLPYSFIGNNHDEIPVRSAMECYAPEAVKFAEQLLLATGYFNTNRPAECPSVSFNYTTLYLTYDSGIEMTFDSSRSRDGVDNCYLSIMSVNGSRLYNGWRRLRTVDEIARMVSPNAECKDASCYLT